MLGTAAYISPEQAAGEPATARERRLLVRRHPLPDADRAAAVRVDERDGARPAAPRTTSRRPSRSSGPTRRPLLASVGWPRSPRTPRDRPPTAPRSSRARRRRDDAGALRGGCVTPARGGEPRTQVVRARGRRARGAALPLPVVAAPLLSLAVGSASRLALSAHGPRRPARPPRRPRERHLPTIARATPGDDDDDDRADDERADDEPSRRPPANDAADDQTRRPRRAADDDRSRPRRPRHRRRRRRRPRRHDSRPRPRRDDRRPPATTERRTTTDRELAP